MEADGHCFERQQNNELLLIRIERMLYTPEDAWTILDIERKRTHAYLHILRHLIN